jgi:hypothetical protein
MWTLLKQLWTDPAAFLAAVRAGGAWLRMALGALGIALNQGLIPVPDGLAKASWYAGLLTIIGALGIGKGDKTPSLVAQCAALTAEEKLAVKMHLR